MKSVVKLTARGNLILKSFKSQEKLVQKIIQWTHDTHSIHVFYEGCPESFETVPIS